jgi:hypothetical protein
MQKNCLPSISVLDRRGSKHMGKVKTKNPILFSLFFDMDRYGSAEDVATAEKGVALVPVTNPGFDSEVSTHISLCTHK